MRCRFEHRHLENVMKRHVKVAYTDDKGVHIRFVPYDNDTTCGPIADKIIPFCKEHNYPSPVFMVERATGAFCHIPVY